MKKIAQFIIESLLAQMWVKAVEQMNSTHVWVFLAGLACGVLIAEKFM